MIKIAETELAEIGRAAAAHVAGLGTVDRVRVVTGQDSTDHPVYFFSFLIDQDRDPQRVGLTRVRLVQKLRDALIARDDGHYPIVEILNRADWEQRESA